MSERHFLVISGPNLNLLGSRETSIYDHGSLANIEHSLVEHAKSLQVKVDFVQHNHEGHIIDALQAAMGKYTGIIINPGALAQWLTGQNLPCDRTSRYEPAHLWAHKVLGRPRERLS